MKARVCSSCSFAHRYADRKKLDESRVVPEDEFMSRTLFSARAGRFCLWLSGTALTFGYSSASQGS